MSLSQVVGDKVVGERVGMVGLSVGTDVTGAVVGEELGLMVGFADGLDVGNVGA